MLAFTNTEEADAERDGRGKARSGVGVRQMNEADLERILELRTVVRWAAEPRAFDLLRGIRDARWAVADASDGALVGMVGAVPLGGIGILCQLAVRDDHRRLGIGLRLSAWAIAYLRSRGAKTVRLYATPRAEKLYESLGFATSAPRTVYRLEGTPREPRTDGGAGGYRIEPLVFGDLPELYGLDRWTYGADRSALISAILRLHPGRGLVARDSSGRMKGYLIRTSTGRAARIGPFVAERDVAGLLLSDALRAGTGPAEVTVPSPADDAAHDLLRGFGFTGREDRLRMELGGRTVAAGPGLTQYGATPYLAT